MAEESLPSFLWMGHRLYDSILHLSSAGRYPRRPKLQYLIARGQCLPGCVQDPVGMANVAIGRRQTLSTETHGRPYMLRIPDACTRM